MPSISRQDLNSTTCHVTVTLAREDLKPKLDAELKRIRQRATIKGFRPGQAPAHYVKSLYGTQLFYETFNEMMAENLYGYLREQKMNVLGQPMPIEDQPHKYTFKIDNPEPEYAITYEVGHVPPFEVQGLDQSHTYERLVVSNLDELAEEDLAYARKRMGERTNPTDGIEANDMLRIAARELENGQIKEGGWETTMTMLVSSIADETLRNTILTRKTGDVVRFNVMQVEENKDETFLRKYVLNVPANDTRAIGYDFEGVIEEVSRVGTAELDQSFFDGYFGEGAVTSVDEAKDQLKKGIAQFYEVRSNALLMRQMQERLMEINRFDLPDDVLKRWLATTNEGRLSNEEIERDFEDFANNLRWSMLRDQIKDRFEIEITHDEIRGEFANRIREYFRADLPDNIIAGGVDRMMKDKKQVEEVETNLETDRIFEAIRSQVSVVDKGIPSKEFQALLDNLTRAAEQEQAEGGTQLID
jgi:trigger factor